MGDGHLGWVLPTHFEEATQVYETVTLPKYTEAVLRAVPHADNLTPTCLGVLTSLGYNRGAGGFNFLFAFHYQSQCYRLYAAGTSAQTMIHPPWGAFGDLAHNDWSDSIEIGNALTLPPVRPTHNPDPRLAL